MEWLDHIMFRSWKSSAALPDLARMSISISDWLWKLTWNWKKFVNPFYLMPCQ